MQAIVKKQIGTDLMFYDGEADCVHILNPAAQLIQELHRDGRGVPELVQALRDRFEVPADQPLEAEVRQALQELEARGLLNSGPDCPSVSPIAPPSGA